MVERKMTLEEAVEKHRILWRGIAEVFQGKELESFMKEHGWPVNVETLKDFVIHKLFPQYTEQQVTNNCFLCDYVKTKSRSKPKMNYCVKYCPLFDPEGEAQYTCLNGHFSDTALALSLAISLPEEREVYRKEAYEAALKIAELPIINRKGEEINE